MTRQDVPLSTETAQAVLDETFPGSRLLLVEPLPGSYSNYTHLVTARAADGVEFRIVVRRYRVFGDYDRGAKARREFTALQCACRNGIPAPQPLYLDEAGACLGIPGIVTRYVPGAQIETSADPLACARALAKILAQIHAVACDPTTRSILLDANAEASWFLRSDATPDYMLAHLDGERILRAMHHAFPNLDFITPTLVHLDYWPGNILWEGDQISAAVDWEEAAFGDPAIDVAYCRMDIILKGMSQAADEFLHDYEAATGSPLANLGFWELAAAAQPMFSPEGWVDESPSREYFAQFIDGAMQRLAA
jgi:aminoglycoside phosphotransferase (APT) family kinase protein